MIRLVNRLNLLRSGSRTYLTSSYTCSTAWEARKADCPTLSKINLDQFYADVETKYQQQRKVSAIDVDIFVNCVTADNYVDEMADIIHKLRNTGEASNILDSTSHAVVRSLIQHDQIDLLLQILRDPLNYGLFLDTFCANLLLDKLLEAKQFTEAAEVASLLMLQEDFGDDITRQMALLAAYKYLDNPEAFVKEEPVPEVDKKAAAPPPPPTKGKKGKKEELRVRVKFLRNPFFDDHFDIRDPRHLVGKTLVRLSSELPKNCQTSSKLMGLCLYEKYADCLTFIDQLGQGDVLHKDVIEKTQKALESKPSESEEYKNLLEKFTAIAGKVTVDENFERLVNASIKSAIEKLEKETIVGQEKIYKNWIEQRDQRLQEELLRLKRVATVKEFEQLAKDMEMEEKKLWYFENEEQLELEIESKQVRYPKRWHGKKKNPRVVDEGYVPPEIKTVRNW